MISAAFYVIAVLAAMTIGALIWKTKPGERAFAIIALLMPVGNSITAYGYSWGLDNANWPAVLSGDAIFIAATGRSRVGRTPVRIGSG